MHQKKVKLLFTSKLHAIGCDQQDFIKLMEELRLKFNYTVTNKAEKGGEIQCSKSSLLSIIIRGDQTHQMILKRLFTSLHHFSLFRASFFVSPISSTCSTNGLLHHFRSPMISSLNHFKIPCCFLTDRHYSSSKHVHSICFD